MRGFSSDIGGFEVGVAFICSLKSELKLADAFEKTYLGACIVEWSKGELFSTLLLQCVKLAVGLSLTQEFNKDLQMSVQVALVITCESSYECRLAPGKKGENLG